MNFSSVSDQFIGVLGDYHNILIETYKEDPKKGRKMLVDILGRKNANRVEPFILKLADIDPPKQVNPRKYDRPELAKLVFDLHQKGVKYTEICDMLNFNQDKDYDHIRYLDRWYKTTVLNPPKSTIEQEKPKKDKENLLSRLRKRIIS